MAAKNFSVREKNSLQLFFRSIFFLFSFKRDNDTLSEGINLFWTKISFWDPSSWDIFFSKINSIVSKWVIFSTLSKILKGKVLSYKPIWSLFFSTTGCLSKTIFPKILFLQINNFIKNLIKILVKMNNANHFIRNKTIDQKIKM